MRVFATHSTRTDHPMPTLGGQHRDRYWRSFGNVVAVRRIVIAVNHTGTLSKSMRRVYAIDPPRVCEWP